MLGSKPDLQMHVKNFEGAKNSLFCDGSHLDKIMTDDEKLSRRFTNLGLPWTLAMITPAD